MLHINTGCTHEYHQRKSQIKFLSRVTEKLAKAHEMPASLWSAQVPETQEDRKQELHGAGKAWQRGLSRLRPLTFDFLM
jgi:hypothetical protein